MDNKYQIQGIPFVLVSIAIGLCAFMQTLDLSIANVALPYIAGDLGVSISNSTWVITLFMVGNAIVLPLSGWLSEKVGSIRLIVISTLLFGITSFLCGIALNFPMVILSRFIQGMCAGPLIPTSQILLTRVFPKGKENMAIALWAMVILIGPISGPIVGGWITETYSWRWIFFINVPVALVAAFIIYIHMKQSIKPIKQKKFDWWGLIFLALGVTALQIFLDQGRNLDWFHSPTIRTLFIIGIISLILFAVYEWNTPNPLVELQLLKISSFTIGMLILGISFMVFFAPIVITPLWLEDTLGYNALNAGICLATMGILPFFLAPLVAKLMETGRLKLLIGFSFVAMAIVSYYFSKFNSNVSFKQVALSRLYFGIGLAFYIAPATRLPLVKIPENKLTSASGILQFFRIYMSGVGTAVYTTIWSNRATYHHQTLGSRLINFNESLLRFKNQLIYKLGFSEAQYLETLNQILDKQAYTLATNDIMLLSSISLLILITLLCVDRVTPKDCLQIDKKNTIKIKSFH